MGKLREYRTLFADLPIELVSPVEVGQRLEVAETGTSFAENAAIKATAYARATGMIALADDSGLEVVALNGAPGLYSSRYGGQGATDADRVAKLLKELKGVPWDERAARFRCAIAITSSSSHLFMGEGVCQGRIAIAPRGHKGFGYDPVFYLCQIGKTMAQIPNFQKNRLSHRAAAVLQIAPTVARHAAQYFAD